MASIEERLEAITATLELVAHMVQDNEKRFDERFAKLLDVTERNERRIGLMLDLYEGREKRLDNLERPPNA